MGEDCRSTALVPGRPARAGFVWEYDGDISGIYVNLMEIHSDYDDLYNYMKYIDFMR